MEIIIKNVNSIEHTRLVKWIGNHLYKDSYTLKKVGKPSDNDYLLTLDPEINSSGLIGYLKSQKYDFVKENKTYDKIRKIIREEVRKSIKENKEDGKVEIEYWLKNNTEWYSPQKDIDLNDYDNVELLSTSYYGDIFYAYNNGDKNNGRLFRGRWNKGIY